MHALSALTAVLVPVARPGGRPGRGVKALPQSRSVQRKAQAGRPSSAVIVRAAIAEPLGRGGLSEVALQSETRKKRLQCQTLVDIAKNTTTIRSLDWDRERFDIEFGLQVSAAGYSVAIRGA